MSWPWKYTPPAVGRSSDRTSRAVVVLPHPLSPTRPSVSPRRRTKSTPSTAFEDAGGVRDAPDLRAGLLPRRTARVAPPDRRPRRGRRRADRGVVQLGARVRSDAAGPATVRRHDQQEFDARARRRAVRPRAIRSLGRVQERLDRGGSRSHDGGRRLYRPRARGWTPPGPRPALRASAGRCAAAGRWPARRSGRLALAGRPGRGCARRIEGSHPRTALRDEAGGDPVARMARHVWRCLQLRGRLLSLLL